MANEAVDLSLLHLEPVQTINSNQAVFEKTYTKPEISTAHRIMTGVLAETYIPILGQFGLGGRIDPGACGVNDSGLKIPVSEVLASPKLISERISHCQSYVDQNFQMWKRNASALKTWEAPPNELLAFLEDRNMDALVEWLLRLSQLGDTTAANVSAGGKITNGVSTTYFTPLDGFWKQAFAGVAAGTIGHVDIPENAGVTYAAQNALASDRAITVFQELKDTADPRMFANGSMPVIQCTRGLFTNYKRYLQDKSLGFMLNRTEEGKAGMWEFDGTPIIVRDDLTRNILAYCDNGTTLDLPHRAWISDINNVPIITSDESDFRNYKGFYSEYHKKYFFDIAFYLDIKILEKYAIQVAY